MSRLTKTCIWLAVALLGAIQAAGQDYPRYRAAGSTFVPLDSWVYPALERLAARGYVRTAMSGMKPWTRIECARLTDEADDQIREALFNDERVEDHLVEVQAALAREFAHELDVLDGGRTRSVRLESVYTRVTSISGPPLTDGLHFGQTVSYDFGRPFRRGTNAIAGGAARAEAGHFAFYVRAEYQHSPSAPALSSSVLDLISQLDATPRNPAAPFAAINRPALIEGYLSVNVRNWQISVGRQSLSWGVGADESLLLSNNAQPLDMVRITRVVPMRLPWFMKWLGPVRTELFVSRLEGLTFVPRPYIYGQKISSKPHPRLELGYGKTTLIGGGNFDVTFATFLRSFFGIRDNSIGTNPGDSRTVLDFAWRMPWPGDSTVLYAELYQDDEPVYFINPKKGIVRAGLLLSRLPRIPRMDLRIEAVSSESSNDDGNGNRNYLNFQYRDGYINRGLLMANTVGRNGRTIEAKSRFWISSQNLIEGSFKHSSVSPDFLPGGAAWEDYSVSHLLRTSAGFYFKNSFQVENIRNFPALLSRQKTNASIALEIGFSPAERKP